MSKKIYSAVNISILVIAVILFYFEYFPVLLGLQVPKITFILLLAVVVVLVNFIKAFRLYIILSGKGISTSEYIKQYCKTIPVSVILPFKIGDMFRIYCFGYHTKSYFAGIVFIIIDRFIDTLALLTIIIVVTVFTQMHFTWILYLLLLFIVVIIAVYLFAPHIYGYWKKYLLHEPATKRSIKYLFFLAAFERVYISVAEVLKGKGTIAYALSICAWLVEIGGATLLEKINTGEADVSLVVEYLSAALGVGKSVYFQHFLLGTILPLICTYVVLHLANKVKER